MRILIVEDERQLNDALFRLLSAVHYGVDRAYDGLEAEELIQATQYDGIILDLMLPKLDGKTLLSRMRARGDATPVLILTARDSVEDRVKGLDAGADDYLVKPFAREELLARVRALLRRQSGPSSSQLCVGDLVLDTATHQVSRGGEALMLSGREFAILEYLMRNKGIPLSRQRIEDHIWNYDYEGGSNVVDVYIRKLRKLIDEGREPKLIHTVRNVGYVLRVPV